jgi:ribosomal protein L11 methyltransferase
VVGAAGRTAYVELRVDAGDEAAEAVTNFLWEQGAVGVVEEITATGSSALRAFFPLTAITHDLPDRVDAYLAGLRALGVPTGTAATLAPLADTDWAAAWREHFHPLPIGRRLLIAPPWETPATSDRLVLTIDPGRAFGTGHHGTTAGCLELLEALLARACPARALDLGCGSGILAIAAIRLGVGEVLACDSDPDAVAAASANATLNGVGDRVRAVVADAMTLEAAAAPLVLANLLAAAHRMLAPRYPGLVDAGGALVAGGLLDPEADDVAATLAAHGFHREEARRLDGWTSLALRHAPLHAAA